MRRRFVMLAGLLLSMGGPFYGVRAAGQDAPEAWAAPPIRNAVSVRDGRTGEPVTLDTMLDVLAQADAVFLGESHDDETTHRLELAVYEGLQQRKPQQVVLALEMFERDVQPILDDYLAGRLDEAQFLAQSRPWANYQTGYRPLFEHAKRTQGPVIASNFPRSLRMQITTQGVEALKNLSPEHAHHAPREFHPNTDAYWRRVDNAIRGHAGMMGSSGTDAQSRLYSTQSLWDNAMGESCADALDKFPGSTVLHINGGFHSAYWDGAVHQLKIRKPTANIRTVSIIPTSNPAVEEVAGKPEADFIAFVEARAGDLNEEMYSVFGQQRIKYRLHIPKEATSEQPVPLLIFLTDNGLTANDGLDLWKERLGGQVAIAVVDAPYRETQEDFGIGGRWFWPDSFASDVGGLVTAVESIWAYMARHFPVDPSRVCVAGEGTGATVAASVALLAGRMNVKAVAVGPKQYAKMKDFSLPLPELLGDALPPQKSLQVIGSQEDAQWWREELEQYTNVGVQSEMSLRSDDPWNVQRQEEDAIRAALGCDALPPATDGPRRYILVEQDAPRAWHWARLHADRLSTHAGPPVAVVSQPPESPATAISTTIRPLAFAAEGALPPCPGPFGGTTVVVLPLDAEPQDVAAWKSIEENDPLAKTSRFYRLRIAMSAGEANLHDVLVKLQSEGRKNILIVPAVFFANGDWMRSLKAGVRDLENELTLQWVPGLGGQHIPLAAASTSANDLPLKHTLSVALLPATQGLRAQDRIELPESLRREGVEFTLSDKLTLTESTPAVERLPGSNADGQALYRIPSVSSDGVLELTYEGRMDHALSDQKEEYTRGFRETRGIIGQEGVYLDGNSGWVPRFHEGLVRFSLEVQLPEGWHVISQGNGTSRDDQGLAKWDSHGLVEQIYLAGGPLLRYSDAAGAVETLVFLRQSDEALARKYLDATAQYLEMYRGLIGPYPYGKFALVENFWETGYGMPSFTLLGPQVIRFPFILHSSYPHEILHNWWGNSVFVDYDKGNWCEGLTAYLADHLVQEQREAGHEYRRSTLQKYRDYVQDGRDFPLTEFRERHNAATEAVGYGKALMMDHMLRRRVGDDAFRSGLAAFYRKFAGRHASFEDLRTEFEGVTQTDLSEFFRQWTTRTGAPVVSVDRVQVQLRDAGFVVTGLLQQTQHSDPYALDVPVTVVTEAGPHASILSTNAREQVFSIPVAARPLSLHVDPMFDLFRLLDPRETPASIGQIFGERRILAVLPAAASSELQSQYRELVMAWRSDAHDVEVVLDSDMAAIPDDRSVWILGRENRHATDLIASNGVEQSGSVPGAVRLGDQTVPFANHSIVLIRRHPRVLDKAVGLLVVEPAAAFAGMARKLPHYGKYSYLAFEGDEPTNTVKGQWNDEGSPLVVDLRENRPDALPPLLPEKRAALAELPPVFSGPNLAGHVHWLSAPEREGRGLGTEGLRQSAEYIAKQMADVGLQPGGDAGTWYQRFTVAQGPDGQPVETLNVIGVLPGRRAEWNTQSILLGAHYDHLGHGWPDVRDAFRGQLHPGADDNASGVAVMLELARVLAAESGGSRNLVFVAFSAEECGRFGSQHYAANPRFPLPDLRGVVNLDTVGRLFDGKIAIHGTSTADEWQHIFRGCGFVTGIPNQIVPEGGQASDQMSFIEKGIPAVQIFTGAHEDYHRPTDTPDKIDVAGLVKVATFVKEAIVYLLEREEPLTVRISGTASSPHAAPRSSASGRDVLFGTVPAFDYRGEGVKVDSLVADSPAERAGLQAGDVITQLDGQRIADLQNFSQLLRKLVPDQTVTVEVVRGEARLTLQVTVVKR
ncbi:MAG: ChaN family lipoprotein [Pirellulaceae bacterium]